MPGVLKELNQQSVNDSWSDKYISFLYQLLERCTSHPQFDELYKLMAKVSGRVVECNQEFKEIHHRFSLVFSNFLELESPFIESCPQSELQDYFEYRQGMQKSKDMYEQQNIPFNQMQFKTNQERQGYIEECLVVKAPEWFQRDDGGEIQLILTSSSQWLAKALQMMSLSAIKLDELNPEELEALSILFKQQKLSAVSQLLKHLCELKKEQLKAHAFSQKMHAHQRELQNMELEKSGVKQISKKLTVLTRLIFRNPSLYNAMTKQVLMVFGKSNKTLFNKLKNLIHPQMPNQDVLKRRAKKAIKKFQKIQSLQPEIVNPDAFIEKQVKQDLKGAKITTRHPRYLENKKQITQVYQRVFQEQAFQPEPVKIKLSKYSNTMFAHGILSLPPFLSLRQKIVIQSDLQMYCLERAHAILSKPNLEKLPPDILKLKLMVGIEKGMERFIEKAVKNHLKHQGITQSDSDYQMFQIAMTQAYQENYRDLQQQLFPEYSVPHRELNVQKVTEQLKSKLITLSNSKWPGQYLRVLHKQCLEYVGQLERIERDLISKPENIGNPKLFKSKIETNMPYRELDSHKALKQLKSNLLILNDSKLLAQDLRSICKECLKCVERIQNKGGDLIARSHNNGSAKLFKPKVEKNMPYQEPIKQSVRLYQAKTKFQKANNTEMVKIQDKALRKMLVFFKKEGCFIDWKLSRFSKICKSKTTFCTALKKELSRALSPSRFFSQSVPPKKTVPTKISKSQFGK